MVESEKVRKPTTICQKSIKKDKLCICGKILMSTFYRNLNVCPSICRSFYIKKHSNTYHCYSNTSTKHATKQLETKKAEKYSNIQKYSRIEL